MSRGGIRRWRSEPIFRAISGQCFRHAVSSGNADRDAPAFVSLREQELWNGVALILPRSKAVIEVADWSSLHRRSEPGKREPEDVGLQGGACRVAGQKKSTRRNAMRLLRAILRDPLDLAQIEVEVREEPALT
jgi:hypothetical protein